MSINRRTAIRQLTLLSVGAALLPSCLHDHAGAGLSMKNFSVDGDQRQLLEELTSTLIPSTDTPGAKEVSAHLFVWKMIDDCSTAADRAKFIKGMGAFDAAAKAASGKSFARCEPAQRESFLAAIEAGKTADPDLNFFYSTTKKLTILAYSSSQYFLTKIQVYEMVPSRWHGCVPVKAQLKSAS